MIKGDRMKFTCGDCGNESFYLHLERQWVRIDSMEFHKLDNLFKMFERNSGQHWYAFCCNCYGSWGPGDCLETLEGIMKEAGVLV